MHHPKAARRLTARQTFVLGAATALGPLSIDLYLPAFPELARELGASEAAVQLTLTACVVGLALGQLVAGPVSDAVGRRVPIAVGLGAWALASFACALAPSIATFTALRFTQGLAGAAGVVVARAVVRDLVSGPELVRSFSKLMLVVGVVPILAPTLGGLLLERTSWRGLFVVLGVLGALLTVVVFVGLRESLPADRRRSGVRRALGSYKLLLLDRGFVGAAAVVSLTFSALFIYVSSSSFVLREVFDLTPGQFGLLFGVNSVGLVLGNQVSGLLANRWPAAVMLPRAVGLGLFGAVLVLVAGLTGALGVVGVVVPLFVIVFSVGAAMPVASSRAMNAHPERAGAASALLGVLQFAVGGALAPLVGLAGSATVLPLAGLMTACLLGSLLVLRFTRRSAGALATA
ncbi:multidrug effflux MFS transporter [Kineosporia sp. A_224]|uniref:multidrug effflux MFS transporter n=1 Tax=Kineosporia sp. A_224 TaxID=1962180 RepID=UPI000B4BA4E0|nr:multidrug effflux MFS transporter [Kineosporia sp. A_224]